MADRRPISAAMNLTDEKRAFIQGRSFPEKPAASRLESEEPRPEQFVHPKPTQAVSKGATEAEPVSVPMPKKAAVKVARSKTQEPIEPDFYEQILVPLTTRLKAPTADALRRACLEQKLARKSPSSQQEIVEIAIAAWLVENRFL